MKHALVITAALVLGAGAAAAQDCTAEGDAFDLDADAVAALYDCIESAMVEGYTAGGNEIAAAYRDWTVTSTRPAVAGPHGERFLQTFANDAGAEQYLKFETGDFEMPVGSMLAKESFKLTDGTAAVGPLFIMTKVAEGEADEFDNWVYTAVQPNGEPMKISQSFCSDCHSGFEDQDSLGYPLEEVRVGAGG
ncbi:recombinase [Rhodobacteraceae bacterium 2CG4]|uniref:Recombinase n=1 Tax=Halovulum marinum TaxID=2662447 RepID=A0A6L5Z6Z7_9RHOB|nr:cytochrome P460 family protein [Halovulum marinum]MSU92227.1 recombinase [Halovulum marinum]